MTTVLTIAPLGGADMTEWCGGWAQRQGGKVIAVPTAANLSVSAIPDAAASLNRVLHRELASSDEDITVMAHSQGPQVAGEWLREYANADPERVSFVFTGNPERPHYGYATNRPRWIPPGNIRGLTPENTRYRVLDISRTADLWGCFRGGLFGVLCLPFNYQHLDYSGVNPDEIDPRHVVKVVGNTTYANVP